MLVKPGQSKENGTDKISEYQYQKSNNPPYNANPGMLQGGNKRQIKPINKAMVNTKHPVYVTTSMIEEQIGLNVGFKVGVALIVKEEAVEALLG